jgi:hypothetical protein
MVSVLALSVVDRGFKPRSSHTKDYKISMCCFSAKHAALRRDEKPVLFGIRIMCPSVPPCLWYSLLCVLTPSRFLKHQLYHVENKYICNEMMSPILH